MIARKPRLPPFTAAAYIDAKEAAGFRIKVLGVDPENRGWLETELPRAPMVDGRAYRTAGRWEQAFYDAGADGRLAVVRELMRRGQWRKFDLYPVTSPLESMIDGLAEKRRKGGKAAA